MPVVFKMPSKVTKPEPIVAAPPQYSDEWLARQFANKHENDLRYIAQSDRWFHFDGKRWQPDELLINIRFAREVCSSAAAECGNMPIGSCPCEAVGGTNPIGIWLCEIFGDPAPMDPCVCALTGTWLSALR